jgi:hypothetical protein
MKRDIFFTASHLTAKSKSLGRIFFPRYVRYGLQCTGQKKYGCSLAWEEDNCEFSYLSFGKVIECIERFSFTTMMW